MRRTATLGLLAVSCAAAVLAGPAGCGTGQPEPRRGADSAPPILQTEIVNIGDSKVTGVKLLQANGRTLGYFLRADKGIVSCPHFDISMLGGAGIPAATAKNWSEHDFQGELDEKILKVNLPARALGIEPGMTVREALGLMNKQNAPGRR
jgi:uncharacterized protein YunC (DUF1805 family)